MFESIVDTVLVAGTFAGVVIEQVIRDLTSMLTGLWLGFREQGPSPRTVLTIQLIVGLLTIIWIIFQFAWLRRLNEARLERHLEGTISAERDELADERTRTLAELERVRKVKGLRWFVIFVWAHARLTISLLLRLLSFGTARGLADHNILLMKAGAEERARGIFTDIARDAMKKIKLYKDAIENKTLEAQNAQIFAGRVALVEGRPAAAVMLFDTAKNLKDDADARLLIVRQMHLAEAHSRALVEVDQVLASPLIAGKPETHSEAHRLRGEIQQSLGHPGLAMQAFSHAREIEQAHELSGSLGKTQELIGDLYAARPRWHSARREAYVAAEAAFEAARLFDQAKRVGGKLRKLDRREDDLPEARINSLLEMWGNWMLTQAARRRARARKKAD